MTTKSPSPSSALLSCYAMSVNQAARVVAKCTKEYLDPVYKQHRLDAVQYKTICKEVCQDIFKVHGFESLQNDDVPPNVRAEVQMLVKKVSSCIAKE